MKQKHKRILTAFLITVASILLMMTPAFADEFDPTTDEATGGIREIAAQEQQEREEAAAAAAEAAASAEASEILNKYGNVGIISPNMIYKMCLITFGNESVTSGIQTFLADFRIKDGFYNAFTSVTQMAKLLGICLLLMYFVMDFMVDKMAPGKELTLEGILITFLKLFICIIIINYAQVLMEKIYQLGEAIFSELSAGLYSNSTASGNANALFVSLVKDYVAEYEAWESSSVMSDILSGITTPVSKLFTIGMPMTGIAVELLLPWIGAVAQVIVVFLSLTTRGIKIAFYTIFAPIGLSDIYNGGTHSRGAGYIKSFFGLCLQTVFILAIIAIFQALKVNVFDFNVTSKDMLNFRTIAELTAMSFSQVTLILGAEKLSSKVFGA